MRSRGLQEITSRWIARAKASSQHGEVGAESKSALARCGESGTESEGFCPEDRTLSTFSTFMKSVIKRAENFSFFSKTDGTHVFGRAAIEFKLAEYADLRPTIDMKEKMGKLREFRRFEFLLDSTQRTRAALARARGRVGLGKQTAHQREGPLPRRAWRSDIRRATVGKGTGLCEASQ